MITIVGLGPGDIEDLSLKAWNKLKAAKTLYLRTSRHPCAPQLPVRCISFDHVYESAASFAEVYSIITEHIMHIAQQGTDVVYAVPGDPLVGEATVAQLMSLAKTAAIDVEIVHGISFIEPCLAQISRDALDTPLPI